MKIPLVDLKKQYDSIKTEIDQAIASVIEKTAFIGNKNNEFIKRFEENYAKWLGVKNTISCANGTDAIEISLNALGVGTDCEVIVPAISWISTAEAVNNAGAKPVFVDVEKDFYTINPDKIEAAITTKTKAIIVVHLYGQPADMNRILVIAKKHNLKVIEDCAQAHGAEYQGKKIGTIGDISTFSFFPSKNLGCYGDGGAICTNDDTLAEKCRLITNHGQLSKNDHQTLGRNSRLDGLQAAILDVKLKYLDDWNKKRRENAAIYLSMLSHDKFILPQQKQNFYHVFHVFAIQTTLRETVVKKLNENGVETAIHYPTPLPFLKPYLAYHPNADNFKISIEMSKKIVSLPMCPMLDEESISKICHILNEI